MWVSRTTRISASQSNEVSDMRFLAYLDPNWSGAVSSPIEFSELIALTSICYRR